ncbi:MAG TPA: hypothetical protein PLJ60_11170 [Chryseolinea sp.]|nr:hypothetical protein [Chryseolinea sp.]
MKKITGVYNRIHATRICFSLDFGLPNTNSPILHYMLGSGFLSQMNETNKQNREMLKKKKHEPFSRNDIKDKPEKETLTDSKKMTVVERELFLKEVNLQRKREDIKRIKILLVSIVATAILIYIVYSQFIDYLIEFITFNK